MRARIVGVTLLLCSCTFLPGAAVHSTPPSTTAKVVVLQPQDIPSLQKCPQSDRWANLMLQGQPEMLPTGFASWSDLQAGGATEGWLSLYADKLPECPLLLGSAPPQGRLVYAAVIKFKDSSSAAASFRTGSQQFPVAPDFSARFTAAGGMETIGASTGFGDNSAVATISFRGVPTYVAYWQKKNFDAVIYADNLPAGDAVSAVRHMSERIH
jgi:hypothetical protein